MAQIQISNLEKSFGDVSVLRNINISIADGEFLVLVGPSGCGKSTLLRIISGLEQSNDGEIWIDGKNVTDLPAKSRDIAMVFQSYALYPHMTVAENMGFSLKLRGEKREETESRVAKVADVLGLTQYLNRKPAALSGGQRQRVAMGRAMVRNPKVFLFDEPLSNLDAKLRVAMRGEIKALHQRLKTTTIYVTHDQIEALTMADRIVVMRGGDIEQLGTPTELFDRPTNIFVAQFIGSPAMNLFQGTISSDEAIPSVKLNIGYSIKLPATCNNYVGKSVLVGIRPEHFELSDSADSLSARIDLVELLGSSVQFNLSTNGQNFLTLFNERLPYKRDDSLRISVKLENMHLFDSVTGNRLTQHDQI
ncbi:MAG: sn-glycerol-3-phosphate ABC transporter ATP-binding protein UgpC [Hyphomicrobiales bacterium]|nr:sn-glycerol-3-phosphate ABC transporter ATP-binding protein UgpC [Hyphomicrobiales bacterium]